MAHISFNTEDVILFGVEDIHDRTTWRAYDKYETVNGKLQPTVDAVIIYEDIDNSVDLTSTVMTLIKDGQLYDPYDGVLVEITISNGNVTPFPFYKICGGL